MNNETGSTPKRPGLHPALWVAAIAVTAFAGVGIGKQMGWIGASNSADPAAETAAADDASAKDKTAQVPSANGARGTSSHESTASSRSHARETNTVRDELPGDARSACADCGTIEAVKTIEVPAEATGVGAVTGGVVGGVLGHQVGKGSGNTVATVAGAVLGGFAGNTIEKKVRTKTRYQIKVKMDNGAVRTITRDTQPEWREGDRVHVNGDAISPLRSDVEKL